MAFYLPVFVLPLGWGGNIIMSSGKRDCPEVVGMWGKESSAKMNPDGNYKDGKTQSCISTRNERSTGDMNSDANE